MLGIALFALIGAMLNAWPAYWIVYGLYCFTWMVGRIIYFFQKATRNDK